MLRFKGNKGVCVLFFFTVKSNKNNTMNFSNCNVCSKSSNKSNSTLCYTNKREKYDTFLIRQQHKLFLLANLIGKNFTWQSVLST